MDLPVDMTLYFLSVTLSSFLLYIYYTYHEIEVREGKKFFPSDLTKTSTYHHTRFTSDRLTRELSYLRAANLLREEEVRRGSWTSSPRDFVLSKEDNERDLAETSGQKKDGISASTPKKEDEDDALQPPNRNRDTLFKPLGRPPMPLQMFLYTLECLPSSVIDYFFPVSIVAMMKKASNMTENKLTDFGGGVDLNTISEEATRTSLQSLFFDSSTTFFNSSSSTGSATTLSSSSNAVTPSSSSSSVVPLSNVYRSSSCMSYLKMKKTESSVLATSSSKTLISEFADRILDTCPENPHTNPIVLDDVVVRCNDLSCPCSTNLSSMLSMSPSTSPLAISPGSQSSSSSQFSSSAVSPLPPSLSSSLSSSPSSILSSSSTISSSSSSPSSPSSSSSSSSSTSSSSSCSLKSTPTVLSSTSSFSPSSSSSSSLSFETSSPSDSSSNSSTTSSSTSSSTSFSTSSSSSSFLPSSTSSSESRTRCDNSVVSNSVVHLLHDDKWLVRLRWFMWSVQNEHNRAFDSLFGRLQCQAEIVRMLRNRLLLQDFLKQHWKIVNAQRIYRPIIIMGLPRTGSTYLQRLLSFAPNAMSLDMWMGAMPVPDESERRELMKTPIDESNKTKSPRYRYMKRNLDIFYMLGDFVKAIHNANVDEAEEDVLLMDQSIASLTLFVLNECEAYFRYLDSMDPEDWDEVFATHEAQLKILQWQKRRKSEKDRNGHQASNQNTSLEKLSNVNQMNSKKLCEDKHFEDTEVGDETAGCHVEQEEREVEEEEEEEEEEKRHWVLKTPAHTFFRSLIYLKKRYPDATFVWTHRDPANVMASTISLVCNFRSLTSHRVNIDEIASVFPFKFAKACRESIHIREEYPDMKFVDVNYSDLMADPEKVVKTIYAKAGLHYSEEYHEKFPQILAHLKQNKFGTHKHSLEHFSLTRKEVRGIFKEYLDYFAAKGIKM